MLTPEELEELPARLVNFSTFQLVGMYRNLKASADEIAKETSVVRDAIQEHVEVEEYQDEDGYAKMLFREASTSYPAKEITRIVEVWTDSDVPEVRTCGELLRSHGKTKPSANYLQIR